jgi:hypothetical protein
MLLYHFTCRDGAAQVERCGELRPNPQPQLGGIPLLWLTDLDEPTRHQIGLTSATLACDRMQRRFAVDCDAQRWVDFVRTLTREQRRMARKLTLAAGAHPMHWYVRTTPVPVLPAVTA